MAISALKAHPNKGLRQTRRATTGSIKLVAWRELIIPRKGFLSLLIQRPKFFSHDNLNPNRFNVRAREALDSMPLAKDFSGLTTPVIVLTFPERI
jgi:hypothetical protein